MSKYLILCWTLKHRSSGFVPHRAQVLVREICLQTNSDPLLIRCCYNTVVKITNMNILDSFSIVRYFSTCFTCTHLILTKTQEVGTFWKISIWQISQWIYTNVLSIWFVWTHNNACCSWNPLQVSASSVIIRVILTRTWHHGDGCHF